MIPIPEVGAACGLTNSGAFSAEGNWTDAASSILAGIPVIGWISEAARLGKVGEGISALDLSPQLRDLAEAHVSNTGVTVLGRFQPLEEGAPNYIDVAQKGLLPGIPKGSSYFDIPYSTGVSRDEVTLANRYFIDLTASRGDVVKLSTPLSKIDGGALQAEISRLISQWGYRPIDDWTLLPPPR